MKTFYNLDANDRQFIQEELSNLNNIIFNFFPPPTPIFKYILAIAYIIFCGVAYVSISIYISHIVGFIALVVLGGAPLFFTKKKKNKNTKYAIPKQSADIFFTVEEHLTPEQELAREAILIMQRCIRILQYPRNSTLRCVAYTHTDGLNVYRQFIRYFPSYKNKDLKYLMKHYT